MPPGDGGSASRTPPRSSGRCRTVHPPSVARTVYLGGAILFGFGAVACLVLGVIGLGSGHIVPGAALVGVAVVAGGLGWMLVGLGGRGGPALTMTVCPAAITMSRHGQVIDTVGHEEVGLVVIRAFGRAGVRSLDVFGPDRSLVGRWATNWGPNAGPIRAIRALRRVGYPWALSDAGAVAWQDKFRSKLAPSWTDEVVRP